MVRGGYYSVALVILLFFASFVSGQGIKKNKKKGKGKRKEKKIKINQFTNSYNDNGHPLGSLPK